MLTWSNFLDPLVYLYDRELFTVPLALKSLAQLDPTNYPLLLAGAVLATVPVVAVFLVAQRWFLHDTEGGLLARIADSRAGNSLALRPQPWPAAARTRTPAPSAFSSSATRRS